MANRLFSLDGNNQLKEMKRAGFVSEAMFQAILADHPALISNDEATPVLIRREQQVADSLDGSGRWSLDHLYVDKNGVPILVEVKRATDTRARREVVAQMLDYAANGVAYWPIGEIIENFSETCRSAGKNPEEVIQALLDGGQSVEEFWKSVEANLRSGRIRMLFVADEIPPELRRIIEFLNEQMRPAEVMAIQIENFISSDGTRTLVPNIVGKTERAVASKTVAKAPDPISVEVWVARLGADFGTSVADASTKVTEWLTSNGYKAEPSTSQDSLAISIMGQDGRAAWPFFIRRSTGGRFETSLQYLKSRPAFSSVDSRLELLNRLKSLPNVELKASDNPAGWASFPVTNLSNAETWNAFTELALWVAGKAREA